MNAIKCILSLTTSDNDYQQEQAAAAQEGAARFGVELTILYAKNDAITQGQQLLEAIQSRTPPDLIVCQPVGTGLAQVANAAVRAKIGWILLNRDEEYLAELRRAQSVPVFSVTVEQEQIGRIQGQQLGKLLPGGGLVLYIEGPSTSYAAQHRTAGIHSTKPFNIQIRSLHGGWTQESGYKAIESWLRISTSHTAAIDLVAAQNDSMALGARKAFLQLATGALSERWSKLSFIGCDACRHTGQECVRKGVLAASIILPPTAGLAIEMAVRHHRTGAAIPERTVLSPASFPALDELTPIAVDGAAGASASKPR